MGPFISAMLDAIKPYSCGGGGWAVNLFNFLFLNNYRLPRNCKNSTERFCVPTTQPLPISSISIAHDRSQEINTGTMQLTRQQTFLRFYQFLHELSFWVSNPVTFYPMGRLVQPSPLSRYTELPHHKGIPCAL